MTSGQADDQDTSDDVPDAEQRALADLREHTYKLALASALGMVALATIVFRTTEDWSWVDAFYFSIVAVTTVGFGDLTPTTDAGKLFTVAYILAGISLIGVVANEALRRHADRVHDRRTNRKD